MEKGEKREVVTGVKQRVTEEKAREGEGEEVGVGEQDKEN